jgi:hypothetical protein
VPTIIMMVGVISIIFQPFKNKLIMKKLAKTLLTLSCVLSTTLFVMMFVFNDIIVEQVGIPTSMSFTSMFAIVSVGTMLMRALHD